MTVIAYFGLDTYPFIVTDMLLSRASNAGDANSIRLPTTGSLADLEERAGTRLPFVATRMVRKAYSVHGKAFVAWAGPVSAGVAMHGELHGLIADDTPMEDAVDTAYFKLSEEDRSSTSLIVAYTDTTPSGAPFLRVTHRNCHSFNSERFGSCVFGGSGASVLSTWTQERESSLLNTSNPDDLEFLPDSICQKLVFDETLLSERVAGPFSALLAEGCGGFYESMRLRPPTADEPAVELAPRAVCHIHVKVDDTGCQITQMTLYYTDDPQHGICTQGVVQLASLQLLPHQLDELTPSQDGRLLIEYEAVDEITCLPFNTGTSPAVHADARLLPSDPRWQKRIEGLKVETVMRTIFEENVIIPREAVNHLSDESQHAAIEEPSLRCINAISIDEASSPIIGFLNRGSHFYVCLDSEWLQQGLESFRNADARTPLIVDEREGFKVLS